MLKAGPDPKFVSYCLGRALDHDNDAAVHLFLKHGADPNNVSPWGEGGTHLHKAVSQPRSEETVRALLQRGADPNFADQRGKTPYTLAVGRGHAKLACLLEEFGADKQSPTNEDRLIGALARGERVPNDGDPAPDANVLCLDARRGDVDAVTRLLAAGVDPSAKVPVPPLHSAGYAGQFAAARLLVERGADLTQLNDFGGTPLGATAYGSLDCCDPQGGPGTLLPEEIKGDYAAIVQLLIEHGSPLPKECWGSEAVQEVLRRHGVPDGNDSD